MKRKYQESFQDHVFPTVMVQFNDGRRVVLKLEKKYMRRKRPEISFYSRIVYPLRYRTGWINHNYLSMLHHLYKKICRKPIGYWKPPILFRDDK